MKKAKLTKKDIEKIKEKEISDEEIAKNEKIKNRNILLLYTIPLILIIVLIIAYILTVQNLLLIPFAIIFLVFLFGMDGKQRTCEHCNKWNSMIWIDTNIVLRKTTKTKKNIFGKEKKKVIKEKVNKATGKCMNCGKETKTEKVRRF